MKRTKNLLKGWHRLSPTLGLTCVVLLGTWMATTNGGYFVGDWAPSALILAAFALFVSVVCFPKDARLMRSTLALGLFTTYTAWTFASILWSPNKGDAWLGTAQTLLYLLAFWVALALVTQGASRHWMLVASVLGPAVVAAFTLSTLGHSSLEYLFFGERLTGTVGYYNGEAAFLLVPFWVAVYLGGSRSVSPILRGAALAGAVLCVEVAVLTQSRGAMVAMAASLPIFFLLSGQRVRGLLALAPIAAALFVTFPGLNEVYLALLSGEASVVTPLSLVLPTVWLTSIGAGLYGLGWGLIDRRFEPPAAVTRAVGGLALVGCLLVLAAGAAILIEHAGNPVVFGEQKWEAFKTNDTTGENQSRYLSSSATGRYTYWQVAREDFATHPFLGVGTQNYEATYYQLRERNSGPIRQPHMLSLEVMLERGIVGGALFFGWLGICLVSGLWERFRNLRSEGKAQVGALAAAITFWFGHSSAEWFWQIPAVTLPAISYLVLLVSPGRGSRSHRSFRKGSLGGSWRAGGVGAAMLAIAVVAPLYFADYYFKKSQSVTDPVEGLAMVEHAQRFNPLDPVLAEREGQLAVDTGDWDRAENAYARAIQLNPQHYAPYMFLAAFYEQRAELEKALLYYRKALSLNPQLDSDQFKQHLERLENQETESQTQQPASSSVERFPGGFAKAQTCQLADPEDMPDGPC